MKILVTGGAGFIASHIVDRFIQLEHDVVVVDNLSSGTKKFVNPKAVFYEVDIEDRGKINDIIKKEHPDVINHHAAQISVRHSVTDPVFDAKANIIGLLHILEVSKEIKVAKIIFASSGGVIYGDTDLIPTPETYQPLFPLSPYGISKLSSEKYLNYYYRNYQIPFVALRYANVYGPRQNPHGEAGVVAIFNLRIRKNLPPQINGDGKQTRDYVYVSDVVEANVSALTSSFAGFVNIGTGIETDVNALASGIQSIYGTNLPAEHKSPKEGEQHRSCLDRRLAKRVLKWEPKIDLQKGLSLTREYFMSYEEE
ncbi:NAD-dependent epimerase/dehydratase family protein [Candidatus Gottesmanbacteria bacterium]|nr:NAD-dependent epimerase/dehydratase family protein [Candidatus Gottesmanbacteria bacterium]